MIELQNVCVTFEKEEALHDVNLKVESGDVISIIGPSGQGKTTLLRTMILLDKPTSGTILYNGRPMGENKDDVIEYRKKIGMVFQDYNLFEDYTILENVMLPQMDLLGRTKQEAYDYAAKWLRKVGLMGKRFSYPDELSTGEKQRAAIARTVAMDPELIFLDEPTNNLDPTMKKEIHQVIRDLAKSGATMVIVSSEMRFAREISNRIVYFDEHTVYEEGPANQIFTDPKRPLTRNFIKQLRLLNIQIDTIDFDFIGIYTRIDRYIDRQRIGAKQANAMHVAFEELCKRIILEHIDTDNEFKLNITYDYDEKAGHIHLTVRYTGDEFNPLEDSDDELAITILQHIVGAMKWEYIMDGAYTNRVTALIQ